MVAELLKRKCDPNQTFESLGAHGVFNVGKRTVWEAFLFYLWRSCCVGSDFTNVHANWESDDALHDLKLKWLKAAKLFLEHGADPTVSIMEFGRTRGRKYRLSRRYEIFRGPALSIFNKVFLNFNDPLVPWVRDFMISKGATAVEEGSSEKLPLETTTFEMQTTTYSTTSGDGGEARVESLQSIPLLGKALAKRRAKNRDGTSDKSKGRCNQS